MRRVRAPSWRSWRLQLGCWGLLVVALGIGLLVQRRQLAQIHVELIGWEQVGLMHFKVPDRWIQRRLPDGVVFEEPGPRTVPRRRIEITRRYCPCFIPPLEYLARSQELVLGDLPTTAPAGPHGPPSRQVRIAGWPGVLVSQDRQIRLGPNQVISRRLTLAAAVLPNSQAVVIKLLGQDHSDADDEDLVLRLAASVIVENVPAPHHGGLLDVADDILVKIPHGFAVAEPPPLLHLNRNLISVDSPQWLCLNLVPLWLAPGETGATLAQRLLLRDPRFDPGEPEQIDDNTWVCRRNGDRMFPAVAYLRTTPSGRALIAEFRWSALDSARQPQVDAMWTQLAKTIAVAPSPDLRDRLKAGAHALETLPGDPARLFARAGAVHDWQWFLDEFSIVSHTTSETQIDPRGILVVWQTNSCPPLGGIGRELGRWSIRHDWSGYEYTLVRVSQSPALSQETRIGNGRVASTLVEGNRPVARGESALRPWFVPGGLLPHILGRISFEPMALETDSFPNTTGAASAVPLLLLLEPAFDMPRHLPGMTEALRCWDIRVSGSGQSSRWYFDANGQLQFVTFADGAHLTPGQAPETLPSTLPSTLPATLPGAWRTVVSPAPATRPTTRPTETQPR